MLNGQQYPKQKLEQLNSFTKKIKICVKPCPAVHEWYKQKCMQKVAFSRCFSFVPRPGRVQSALKWQNLFLAKLTYLSYENMVISQTYLFKSLRVFEGKIVFFPLKHFHFFGLFWVEMFWVFLNYSLPLILCSNTCYHT